MKNFVDFFSDIKNDNFHQKSIYVDACILLAFLDGRDVNGDKVAEALEKWGEDGIGTLGISNHVISEVVHKLFVNDIYKVINLTYRKLRKNEVLKKEEDDFIGDLQTARNLMSLVEHQELERLYNGRRTNINIGEVIKNYKRSFIDRQKLSHYYSSAQNTFEIFLNSLHNDFGIDVSHLSSDKESYFFAHQYMKDFQLEITDALHLAITKQNSFDFFATLDGDFIHDLYEGLDMTRILRIA
ncbi:hypothetical protein AB986_18095 [Alkalihalobacillus macyae]|uniref:PIN domain-containing protein n=2 Tax=Guptibacillus hwajinpoensis TaxID=208199 RepID=A0A0J6CJG8_9BACL|nr:hypothetical protein AB986_18095 [Alkalihalobacillus macyae]